MDAEVKMLLSIKRAEPFTFDRDKAFPIPRGLGLGATEEGDTPFPRLLVIIDAEADGEDRTSSHDMLRSARGTLDLPDSLRSLRSFKNVVGADTLTPVATWPSSPSSNQRSAGGRVEMISSMCCLRSLLDEDPDTALNCRSSLIAST